MSATKLVETELGKIEIWVHRLAYLHYVKIEFELTQGGR